MGNRVAIVGSRTFNKPYLVDNYIYNLPAGSVIISGGAVGVDEYAATAADKYGFELIEHLAEWEKNGKSAGPLRNQLIVDDCDYVVAFWNGISRGTKSTIDLAIKAKKQIFVFLESGDKQIIGTNWGATTKDDGQTSF